MNGSDTAEWDLNDDSGELQSQASFSEAAPSPESTHYLWLDSNEVHDFFLIQDSDDLDFANENIGISAWIYPTDLNDVHYLVNKGDQSTSPKTTNYSLRTFNNKLEFLIRDEQDRARKVTSSFELSKNQWTFVAAFYDFNAGQVYLWNDATSAPVDTLAFNQNIFTNNDPLAIGSWFRSDSTKSWKDFEGGIDEVRISGRLEDILPDVTSSVASDLPHLPQEFVLFQNYPNPFNPTTNIAFRLSRSMEVSLKIYNLAGQLLYDFVTVNLDPGDHERTLDASGWPSGLYVYELRAGRFTATQKMLLLR